MVRAPPRQGSRDPPVLKAGPGLGPLAVVRVQAVLLSRAPRRLGRCRRGSVLASVCLSVSLDERAHDRDVVSVGLRDRFRLSERRNDAGPRGAVRRLRRRGRRSDQPEFRTLKGDRGESSDLGVLTAAVVRAFPPNWDSRGGRLRTGARATSAVPALRSSGYPLHCDAAACTPGELRLPRLEAAGRRTPVAAGASMHRSGRRRRPPSAASACHELSGMPARECPFARRMKVKSACGAGPPARSSWVGAGD
jgi:hypothetical protein